MGSILIMFIFLCYPVIPYYPHLKIYVEFWWSEMEMISSWFIHHPWGPKMIKMVPKSKHKRKGIPTWFNLLLWDLAGGFKMFQVSTTLWKKYKNMSPSGWMKLMLEKITKNLPSHEERLMVSLTFHPRPSKRPSVTPVEQGSRPDMSGDGCDLRQAFFAIISAWNEKKKRKTKEKKAGGQKCPFLGGGIMNMQCHFDTRWGNASARLRFYGT